MNDLDAILERLERNEEIAKKFFEVEVTILSVLNFKDLFERLLTEIREKFAIPYVWITLIEEGDLAPLIPGLFESDVVRQRLSVVSRDILLGLIGTSGEPILVNEDLSAFYKLFPDNEKYLIRSLALVPITLNGQPVGTLNLADTSPERYSPGMNTTLLKRLGIKVSVCLSNVVAHERVKLSSSRDEITGLLTTSAMEEILDREFQRAIRYESSLSVILLEVALQEPKESLSVKERLPVQLAGKLIGEMRPLIRITDVVGMHKEGRFLIILPSTTRNKAMKLLERLDNFAKSNSITLESVTHKLRIRGGIGSTSDAGVMDARSLLREAQKRLGKDG